MYHTSSSITHHLSCCAISVCLLIAYLRSDVTDTTLNLLCLCLLICSANGQQAVGH